MWVVNYLLLFINLWVVNYLLLLSTCGLSIIYFYYQLVGCKFVLINDNLTVANNPPILPKLHFDSEGQTLLIFLCAFSCIVVVATHFRTVASPALALHDQKANQIRGELTRPRLLKTGVLFPRDEKERKALKSHLENKKMVFKVLDLHKKKLRKEYDS